MESKISKIFLSIILLSAFLFCFWVFTGQVFLADYYYQKAKKTEDWPKVLANYQKTFSLFSQEPFYHQKFAKDLKWGLQFYSTPEIKVQIIDLAINQMEKIKEEERSFNTKVYLAQLYLLKSGLTREEQDFLKTEKAFQSAVKMSPQVAKVYVDWCQLRIYQQKYDQAEEMCQKAFEFYPPLDHPVLTERHKNMILSEMSQVYEKLGEIYLAEKEYDQAIYSYYQALESFPLGKTGLWKKLGDVYYLQGNIKEAIAKNKHGHVLAPKDSFWCLNLALLYQEKGDLDQTLFWVEKGLELDSENKGLLEIKDKVD